MDGSLHTSDYVPGTFYNSATDLVISRLSPGSSFGAGLNRLQACRITDGVARYADDAGYTVPTLPLPTAAP